ncbi:hypothetical protein HNQ88_003706 [Aureibacter tunicatorum]|uniref:Uncharacterized protein n=1 Tax=Aureibacter tunicatorum TaxID=866807 RepID=A0AAE3XRK0_9BACT|nr:hypothetical protein [Aureibacter tunicatorum]BDD06509.1 hypothetical protein AUTU_39920 [Aureibacter tunicatorum]
MIIMNDFAKEKLRKDTSISILKMTSLITSNRIVYL